MFCSCIGCQNRQAKPSDNEAVNESSKDIDINTIENNTDSGTSEEDDSDLNNSVDRFDESSVSSYDSSNEDMFCDILGDCE